LRQPRLQYIGHIVSLQWVEMDPSKVQAIFLRLASPSRSKGIKRVPKAH